MLLLLHAFARWHMRRTAARRQRYGAWRWHAREKAKRHMIIGEREKLRCVIIDYARYDVAAASSTRHDAFTHAHMSICHNERSHRSRRHIA